MTNPSENSSDDLISQNAPEQGEVALQDERRVSNGINASPEKLEQAEISQPAASFKRQPVIAGNWKMYKSIEEGVAFVKALIPLISFSEDLPESSQPKVYLAVPFTCIKAIGKAARGSRIVVGAQNMNDASEGAFTGEIAARMLKEVGARFVILGHSERRIYFHEDNACINRKVKRALTDGLQPILCVGETLELYEAGKSKETVEKQLAECLAGLSAEQIASCIIAYEPVWAIGSGRTATPEMAQQIHHACRQFIQNQWGADVAEKVVIQYGGSVKPQNAAQLMEQKDIDGLLVGGASLSLDLFSQIVNYNRHAIVPEGESI